MIYTGDLSKNGITSALGSLLRALDPNERNYYITFATRKTAKNRDWLKTLPEGISYLPRFGKMPCTREESEYARKYDKGAISFEEFDAHLGDAYLRDFKRYYPCIRFDALVHFVGYGFKSIYAFSKYPARRVIFVHNDMVREYETRRNIRPDLMKYAYGAYDGVAMVSEDLREPTGQIAGTKENLSVVTNQFDDRRVRELAEHEMAFDENTVSNMPLERVKELLETTFTFMTIGRFSPEKQHLMLIRAFDKYHQAHPDASLVIIGGRDNGLYEESCALAASLPSADHIALILQLTNPYAFLKEADGFIISSMYEGLPVVIFEADVLGVPVVTTDIPGPRSFMKQYGGTLVENSEEGIYGGLSLMGEGKVLRLAIDFEEYNRRGMETFERLLTGESDSTKG